MAKIPVVVVDDNEVDRYMVKRWLSKADDFEQVVEVSAGDTFLETFFNGHSHPFGPDRTLLVLMDINMPRMDGFETVREIEVRVRSGKGPHSVVILMFTSSNNPHDKAVAEELALVKGYVVKPLEGPDIDMLRDTYWSNATKAR